MALAGHRSRYHASTSHQPARTISAGSDQGDLSGGHNIRDDSQVVTVVDKDEPQGLVSIKNTEYGVPAPGLGIEVCYLGQEPFGLIEQRQKLC